MDLRKIGVSVVIPNYNGEKLLKKHLPSVIRASKNKKNKIKEIIVVDDASTDYSVEFLKSKYKQVKIIKHKINRGFSSTVNTGARTAQASLICLLNSDVTVYRNFLEFSLPNFSDNKVFAISFHEKGYGWAKGSFVRGFVVHAGAKESKKTKQTFWANGGSSIFRRDVWHQLKGMDEKLLNPFYWEDIDICYRAQKRGYICLWEPKSRVIHKHESTIPKAAGLKKRQRIQERNQLLFVWKNITSPILFKKHLKGLRNRIRKNPGYLRIFLMAAVKFRAAKALRKIEKKESTVSDEAIFQRFQV